MIRITEERGRYKSANMRLRRARRLYVYFCRHTINTEGNPAIDRMAEAAHERGLYAASADARHIRQSMQSYLFRIEVKQGNYPNDWWPWILRKGMDAREGNFNAAGQKAVG